MPYHASSGPLNEPVSFSDPLRDAGRVVAVGLRRHRHRFGVRDLNGRKRRALRLRVTRAQASTHRPSDSQRVTVGQA